MAIYNMQLMMSLVALIVIDIYRNSIESFSFNTLSDERMYRPGAQEKIEYFFYQQITEREISTTTIPDPITLVEDVIRKGTETAEYLIGRGMPKNKERRNIMEKWNWEMDEKTQRIYENLLKQIKKIFRHVRQGSKETRYRYRDGVNHFAKFMAEVFKKQNLNKIENKHLESYVEQMIEAGYSKSYISTNLSAIRFFIDQFKDSSYIKSNTELGAIPRSRDEIIGPNRAWKIEEIKGMKELAIAAGNDRVADMIQLSTDHGFRIHEVIRLERVDLQRALKEGYIRIKGKGGLVRDVPVQNKNHLQELIDKTSPRKAKVFVNEDEKGHQVIEMVQQFIYKNREKVIIYDGSDRGKLTFHSYRHNYCQDRFLELKHQGLSSEEARKIVSKELGHFRVEITDVYLNFRKGDRENE